MISFYLRYILPLCILIMLVHPSQGQEYQFQKYTVRNGLSNSNVFRIFQDKRGFIWFSTNYGLSCFNGKSFRNYYSTEGLTDNCILSISENNEGLKYVSTYGGGINVLTDTAIYPLHIKDHIPKSVLYTIPYQDVIWTIALNKQKRLHKIYKNKIELLSIKKQDSSEAICYKLAITGGQLYCVTNNGLYKIDSQNNVIPFLHNIAQGEINDFRQDKNGDYWIALKEQVIQVHNGEIINTYTLKDKFRVSNILVDHDNTVWLATLGEGILFIKNNQLLNLNAQLKIHKIIINDLFEDSEGNIWIATHGEGVYRINSLNILNYPVEENKLNVYCKAITSYKSNKEFLIGSIGTVSVWNNEKLTPLPFSMLKKDHFIYFIIYENDKILLGTPYGIIEKNDSPPYTERMIPSSGKQVGALCYLKDSKGVIWIGSYDGIYHLQNDRLIPASGYPALHGKRCNTIYEDHTGALWFGTDSGVVMCTPTKCTYYSFGKDPAANYINKILEDSYHRIWIATEHGLSCLYNNLRITFTTQNGLANNKCNTIIEANNNMLWIGTLNGLSCINLTKLTAKEYWAEVYPDEVFALYSIDSTIFIGMVDGLSVIHARETNTEEIAPPLYILSAKTGNRQFFMPRKINLSYNDNKLLLDFIAISYRYPDMVEYRYKIEGLDENWHTTKNNSIELSSIPSGSYRILLSARQNKGKWSENIAMPIYISTPFWKTWWFITAATISVLFISRWQIYVYEKKKRKNLSIYNKIIYLKQQALSALINPHFIFNCMNSIQHFLNKNDNDLANQYLADFAQLIRSTIENAQEAFIGLHKEIARIQLYLSLEHLRCGTDLQYQIIVDPELNAYDIRIPNMILQPYIENAIWHGIMPKNVPGNLSIFFFKNNEHEIKIIVQDNGIGLNSNKTDDVLDEIEIVTDNDVPKIIANNDTKKHRSLGMSLTKERLDLLKRLLGQYYIVTAKETKDSDGKTTGTMVEIILPMKPNEKSLSLLNELE